MYRAFFLLRFALYSTLFFPAILRAQVNTNTKEVRVSSRPYQPSTALRVETNLVQIDVVVRDKHGRAITGLDRNNFQIFDEGKECQITAFSVDEVNRDASSSNTAPSSPGIPISQESNVRPRFLALFFDDVNTQDGPYIGSLHRAQTAAERFIKDALQPGIRIGVFTASGTQALDFTTDRAKLNDTIKALTPHPRISEKGLSACPTISPYRAYVISQNHDPGALGAVMAEAGFKDCPIIRSAVISISEETWRRVREASKDTLSTIGRVVDYLGQMPGNRILILTSPGFMGVTLQEQQDRVVDQARRAGVVINALDAKGLFGELPPGTRPDDYVVKRKIPDSYIRFETMVQADRMLVLEEPMAELAAKTGGVFFHDNNDLNAGFRELGDAPEVTYRLAFKPENIVPNGSFHAVKVKFVGSGSRSITATPGYFAETKSPMSEALRSKLDREVFLQDSLAEFPMNVSIQENSTAANQATLGVLVHFDIAQLQFSKSDDRRVQKVTLITAILDSQQHIVAAKEGTMDFALKDTTYNRLSQTGVNAKLNLQVPLGSYTLREVVQDNEGKIACLSRGINVR